MKLRTFVTFVHARKLKHCEPTMKKDDWSDSEVFQPELNADPRSLSAKRPLLNARLGGKGLQLKAGAASNELFASSHPISPGS